MGRKPTQGSESQMPSTSGNARLTLALFTSLVVGGADDLPSELAYDDGQD